MQFYRLVLLCILLAGCASPHLSSELQSGRVAFQSGNYFRAFRELLPLARAGRAEAQYAVGYMYYYGLGVLQNTVEGLHWIEASAAANYAPAREALAMIHHQDPHHEISQSTLKLKKASQQKQNKYVLQFYGSYSLADVKKLAQGSGMKDFRIYHTRFNQRDWYVLTSGYFNNVHAAQAQKNILTAKLDMLHPWIRTLHGLDEIQQI